MVDESKEPLQFDSELQRIVDNTLKAIIESENLIFRVNESIRSYEEALESILIKP